MIQGIYNSHPFLLSDSDNNSLTVQIIVLGKNVYFIWVYLENTIFQKEYYVHAENLIGLTK